MTYKDRLAAAKEKRESMRQEKERKYLWELVRELSERD